MDPHARLADRLKWQSAAHACRVAGAWIAHLLSPRTPQEHERRRAYLSALLMVAAVATAKHVATLTEGSAPFTLYGLAIAASAFVGGFAPALVATLAAVLLADAHAQSPIGTASRFVFALEGLGVAWLVSALTARLREAGGRLVAAQAANDELSGQARRDHVTHLALEHLEEMTPDAAVFVVNAHGLIVEWSRSAERMYGYSAEEIVGSSLAAIIADPAATTGLQDLVMESADEQARRSSVHRRSDETVVHVEFEVKPCRSAAAGHFTVAVHDLSRRHEIDAFREAALRAQGALQEAADAARSQVEVLESLTDPSVNPVAGLTAVAELLERLRSSLHADGVAFVEVGRMGTRILSSAGLRAAQVRAAGGAAGSAPADGRVALVHNDAARVAQVSALTWPSAVSSIMVVPVAQAGQAGFRIEVINERRARATEWDLALARIVADRFAQVNTQQLAADSSDAVA